MKDLPVKDILQKGREKLSNGFGKFKKSKYKHIVGFFAFVLIVGEFVSFGAGMTKGIDSNSMGDMQADLYRAYSAPSFTDIVADSVSGAMDMMTPEKESVNYSPSWNLDAGDSYDASESYMESPVVSENDYLTTDNTAYQSQTEKLVYSAVIDAETKDIDFALDNIYAKIKEYGGIIQDENRKNMGNVVYDDYYRHTSNASAYISVRVPQENYDAFINSIEDKDGNIVVCNISKKVQNMTKQYYNTESRLRSLRIQEERLFDFMESAKSVSEMLDVEDRLTDVQYEIDSATNSLATIDNDVKYSKVRLDIKEVVKYTDRQENPKNFFERVWGYMIDSLDNFLDNCEDIIEVAIYAIPNIFLLVVFYLVIVKVFRVIKAKRKAKKEKLNKSNGIEDEK